MGELSSTAQDLSAASEIEKMRFWEVKGLQSLS